MTILWRALPGALPAAAAPSPSAFFDPFTGTTGNAFAAGPWITSPSTAYLDPWQGQSQVRSVSFQSTVQPMWVHRGDSARR
jgi:hypothetical protein